MAGDHSPVCSAAEHNTEQLTAWRGLAQHNTSVHAALWPRAAATIGGVWQQSSSIPAAIHNARLWAVLHNTSQSNTLKQEATQRNAAPFNTHPCQCCSPLQPVGAVDCVRPCSCHHPCLVMAKSWQGPTKGHSSWRCENHSGNIHGLCVFCVRPHSQLTGL